jgi:protease-4
MRIIVRVFAVIGFLATLMTILLMVGVYWLVQLGSKVEAMNGVPFRAATPQRVADSTVLTLDLERPVTEAAPNGFESIFGGGGASFAGLLDAIERGRDDARIKGMVVRAGEVRLGLAEAQELRDAIKAFRAKGKFAYAYGESFGELAGGTRAYYVASAFDEIWLQPAGSLALTGVASEVPFFKGTFDRLGIVPQFERRGEFKSAATEFTDTKLPDSDRAAMTDMIHSIYDQMAAGIADGRKITEAQVKSLVDGGPYAAQEALDNHLVDHLGYADEVDDAARKKAGGAQLLSVDTYEQVVGRNIPMPSASSSIALIRAVGEIVSGASDDGPFGNSNGNVAADTIARAFEEAVKDPAVKAIVFRIDSPGGSEVASETIWRAVRRAQLAGKPVIVSMGDVAASGGYYIAASADRIVAEPLTITGSIGVFGGKFVVAGLWDKLGVSWDTISVGKNADMAGSLAEFTPEQRQRFAALIDIGYKGFIGRVAEGRHLQPDAVDAIARGRVWTGVEAKDRGLVDVLGGFDDAFKLAKQAAHLAADQKVALKSFPRRRSPFETLMRGFSNGEGPAEAFAVLNRLAALEPLLRRLDMVTEAHTEDAMMRPMDIRD